MKNPSLLALTASLLMCSSCVQRPARQTPAPVREDGRTHAGQRHEADASPGLPPGFPRPRVGMTRAEVMAMYGRPYITTISSRNETWFYLLNLAGGGHGGFFRVPVGQSRCSIYFDRNGRVREYVVSTMRTRG